MIHRLLDCCSSSPVELDKQVLGCGPRVPVRELDIAESQSECQMRPFLESSIAFSFTTTIAGNGRFIIRPKQKKAYLHVCYRIEDLSDLAANWTGNMEGPSRWYSRPRGRLGLSPQNFQVLCK
jgi:hypothetical protein